MNNPKQHVLLITMKRKATSNMNHHTEIIQTMKKSIQLIAMVLISFIPFQLQAYDFEVDGIFYTITSTANLTCKVSGARPELDKLVIPQQVSYMNRDLWVNEIADEAFLGSGVHTVVLLTKSIWLGNSCFENSDITTIENMNSIYNFGKNCFKNCTSLKKIEFRSDRKIFISTGCFYGCSSLESIDVPSCATFDNDGSDGAFENCNGLKEANIDCSELQPHIFARCSSLATVSLGENCTKLGMGSFAECSGLESIVLPPNVRSIGSACFYGCSALTGIVIPHTVVEIGGSCFARCSSLKSIIIPESIKFPEPSIRLEGYGTDNSIIDDKNAQQIFSNCTALETVEWNANTIPSRTFEKCTSLNTLTIGGNTSQICLGEYVFYSDTTYCTFKDCNIKTLKILHGEKSLELYFEYSPYYPYPGSTYAFNNCDHIKRLKLQDLKELLQMFNKVEELYIARYTKGIYHNFYRDEYINNNLKRLIIGYNCPCLSVGGETWNGKNIEYLRSECTTPPDLPDVFTTHQYTTMEVDVPAKALESYKTAPTWKSFWNLNGFNAITDVVSDDNTVEVARYNLKGNRVDSNVNGPVIIQYSDGKTRKTFIR